jgi:hypothetical protein
VNRYNGDPGKIEEQLEAARARLGSHLSELTRRLSPGQLIDEGLSYLRDGQGAMFARNLGTEIRDNPLPVALTAMGLVWLAVVTSTSSRRDIPRHRAIVPYDQAQAWRAGSPDLSERVRRASEAVRRNAEETEDAFSARLAEARAHVLGLQQEAAESAAEFADRVQSVLDSAQKAASDRFERMQQSAAEWKDDIAERGQRAGEAVSDAAQRGRDMAARAGSGIADAISDNPLLLGALLPNTAQEEALLAPLNQVTRRAVDEAVTRGTRAAEAAASAAYEAVQE